MGIMLAAKACRKEAGRAQGYKNVGQVFYPGEGCSLRNGFSGSGNISVQRTAAAGRGTEARKKTKCLRAEAKEPE